MASQHKEAPVLKGGKGSGPVTSEQQEADKAQKNHIETLDWLQNVLVQALQVESLAIPQLPSFVEIVRKRLHDLKGEPTREESEQELRSLTDKKAAKVAKLKKNEQEVLDLKLRLETLVLAANEVQAEVTVMEKRMKQLVENLHANSREEDVQMPNAEEGQDATTQLDPGSQGQNVQRPAASPQVPIKGTAQAQGLAGTRKGGTGRRSRSRSAEAKG